jgi:hypothetical protein
MLRAIIAGGLTCALSLALGGGALGETVSDTAHNFRILVPEGWKSEQNPSQDISIVMVAPDREQTGANCNVVTEANPSSKAMTQEQVDAGTDKEVTDEAWAAVFKAIIFIDNITIEKTGTERLNGYKGHYVVASFSSVMPGQPVRKIKLKQDLVAIPGQLFFITCSASAESFAAKEEEFKTVFASFSPLGDAIAANERGGIASLTLYAQARFGGASRVVTRDTPDLALAGWREAAGSLSVAGEGLWQVCDGANYAGACRLVAGALHERLAVGSVRRLSPGQTNFGMMLQAGGAQATRALLRRLP